jgi:hypothetical protein
MLKDWSFLRSVNVKYRGCIEPVITCITEHLFQPKTPMPPSTPPIYGVLARFNPPNGIFALKILE